MLYSKNGSIPKPETDGTEGWVEVPEAPTAGEGEEVVWWSPPGWVVRPIKPNKTSKWSQSEGKWVDYPQPADKEDKHPLKLTVPTVKFSGNVSL